MREEYGTAPATEGASKSIAELDRHLALQTMLGVIKAVGDRELEALAVEALRPLAIEAMQRIGK